MSQALRPGVPIAVPGVAGRSCVRPLHSFQRPGFACCRLTAACSACALWRRVLHAGSQRCAPTRFTCQVFSTLAPSLGFAPAEFAFPVSRTPSGLPCPSFCCPSGRRAGCVAAAKVVPCGCWLGSRSRKRGSTSPSTACPAPGRAGCCAACAVPGVCGRHAGSLPAPGVAVARWHWVVARCRLSKPERRASMQPRFPSPGCVRFPGTRPVLPRLGLSGRASCASPCGPADAGFLSRHLRAGHGFDTAGTQEPANAHITRGCRVARYRCRPVAARPSQSDPRVCPRELRGRERLSHR